MLLRDRIYKHQTAANLSAARQWAQQIVADLATRADFVTAYEVLGRPSAENLPAGLSASWTPEVFSAARQRVADALVERWRKEQIRQLRTAAVATAIRGLQEQAWRKGIELDPEHATQMLREAAHRMM